MRRDGADTYFSSGFVLFLYFIFSIVLIKLFPLLASIPVPGSTRERILWTGDSEGCGQQEELTHHSLPYTIALSTVPKKRQPSVCAVNLDTALLGTLLSPPSLAPALPWWASSVSLSKITILLGISFLISKTEFNSAKNFSLLELCHLIVVSTSRVTD